MTPPKKLKLNSIMQNSLHTPKNNDIPDTPTVVSPNTTTQANNIQAKPVKLSNIEELKSTPQTNQDGTDDKNAVNTDNANTTKEIQETQEEMNKVPHIQNDTNDKTMEDQQKNQNQEENYNTPQEIQIEEQDDGEIFTHYKSNYLVKDSDIKKTKTPPKKGEKQAKKSHKKKIWIPTIIAILGLSVGGIYFVDTGSPLIENYKLHIATITTQYIKKYIPIKTNKKGDNPTPPPIEDPSPEAQIGASQDRTPEQNEPTIEIINIGNQSIEVEKTINNNKEEFQYKGKTYDSKEQIYKQVKQEIIKNKIINNKAIQNKYTKPKE